MAKDIILSIIEKIYFMFFRDRKLYWEEVIPKRALGIMSLSSQHDNAVEGAKCKLLLHI